jgi:hypothetical protein
LSHPRRKISTRNVRGGGVNYAILSDFDELFGRLPEAVFTCRSAMKIRLEVFENRCECCGATFRSLHQAPHDYGLVAFTTSSGHVAAAIPDEDPSGPRQRRFWFVRLVGLFAIMK